MKLEVLLQSVATISIDGPLDREITSIAYDSRRVQPGALFAALPGEKVDGAVFVSQAIEQGAVAVLTGQEETASRASTMVLRSSSTASRATTVVVKNPRLALADVAANFYQHPSRALKVAGITGTNGKTTTAFLLKHICERALHRCGLIGTVRYEVGDRILPAARTTPEALEVQELLWQMRSAGCKAAVMEVSSHALVQARVRNVEFDAAIFSNLTLDHLDFHQTMDAYAEAKAQLFTSLLAQKKKAKAAINLDDRYGAQFITRFSKELPVITYGLGVNADFRASNVRIDFNGTSYQLDANGRNYLVRLPVIGQFNVYNSLAALAGAHAMGIDVRTAVLALADSPPVPGRLEAVPGQRKFRVFVDYAHTDDALLNVIKTCRELNPARLIVVFGCGGTRDRSKRPRMGAVVDQHADYAIVTSDNPRKEDPLAIIADIKPGMPRGNYEVIVDRKEAIFKAIAMAQPRDIILIAGKGHETYQEFADHTVPFDDVAVATQALEGKRVEL
jgi:UDP-N-acetylmuramoyl-L-alanyl-D-glutamate--2,6-diaminopimelate ligase